MATVLLYGGMLTGAGCRTLIVMSWVEEQEKHNTDNAIKAIKPVRFCMVFYIGPIKNVFQDKLLDENRTYGRARQEREIDPSRS